MSGEVNGKDQWAIPLSEPALRAREWEYLQACLETKWVSTAGPFVRQFERSVADYLGVPHAVATVNGTAALHVALLVAGVQQDQEVLISSLSFIAPANAVRYVGAWPVFIDVEPRYWQIDPEKLADFANRECQWKDRKLVNRITGRQVVAILPVHILGHPCDMEPVLEVARKYQLAVIEDASESLGAIYEGGKVGCFGDIACFSFNGNKIITTGGGGMIVTREARLAERARYLITQAKDDPVEYVHQEVGYNYGLTNLQAALGCAQMERLGAHIRAKRTIASAYASALTVIPGVVPMRESRRAKSIFWLYTILIQDTVFGFDRQALMRLFESRKIQTRPLWQPLPESRPYRMCQAYLYENTPRIHRQALSLPSSVGLTVEDQRRVVDVLLGAQTLAHAG